MTEQFSIIYDVILVAVLVGMMFAGAKKGFAAAAVSFAAVLVAFVCAMALSEPLSVQIYNSSIKQPLESAVDEKLEEAVGGVSALGLSELDYDKVLISGVPAGEIDLNYGGTRRTELELTDLDLSETGISEIDLSVFGISSDVDFTSVSGKTADFTMSDIEKYGLGRMAVAQYIAVNAVESDFFEKFDSYTDTMVEELPYLANLNDMFSNAGITSIRALVLNMTIGAGTVRDAVFDSVIEPYFIMGIKSALFIVIFIIMAIILGIVANALKIINKIPLIGDLNSLLGGVAGLIKGAFTVCVICIAVRMTISLSGGDIPFLNETAIAETYLFKHVYGIEFLNFFG